MFQTGFLRQSLWYGGEDDPAFHLSGAHPWSWEWSQSDSMGATQWEMGGIGVKDVKAMLIAAILSSGVLLIKSSPSLLLTLNSCDIGPYLRL